MPTRVSAVVRLAGVQLALVLIALLGTVGLAAPAWAAPCASPYNYNYELTGLKLAQSPASPSTVGGTLVLTATVTGTQDGTPNIEGVCVDFTVGGVNAMPAQHAFTDTSGKATISYPGNNQGTDTIQAQAVSGNQGPSPSARLTHVWVKATPSPTPSPKPSLTPSPTPSPTPKPTRSRTPSPTPSPTASPTPSATPSPTASPTPVPTASGFGDGSIELDEPSAVPGGTATVSGRNCPPGSDVTFAVEGTSAGATTAGPDGTFASAVQLPETGIGRHLIEVTCAGSTATVAIDLVLSSGTSTPAASATAVAVLVFFVLLGSVLFARNSPRRRRVQAEESDPSA